jgi:inorganic pyrophosphatase
MDMYRLPVGQDAPRIANAVIEIPGNTRNKVEYDPELGVFCIDRVLYSPVRYPGDYGFIPGTLSPDGDALDVLVTEPTFTGCFNIYKELEGKETAVLGWYPIQRAHDVIKEARQRFTEKHPA